MGRTLLGSLAAGLVMFVLGFVFFGSPLYAMLGGGIASDAQPEVVTLVMGFIQLSVAAWALSVLLSLTGARMQVVIWTAITAMLFTYIGDPIWEAASWQKSIYSAVAGFVMLTAAGYVLIRWFAPAPATAATA